MVFPITQCGSGPDSMVYWNEIVSGIRFVLGASAFATILVYTLKNRSDKKAAIIDIIINNGRCISKFQEMMQSAARDYQNRDYDNGQLTKKFFECKLDITESTARMQAYDLEAFNYYIKVIDRMHCLFLEVYNTINDYKLSTDHSKETHKQNHARALFLATVVDGRIFRDYQPQKRA